MFEQLVVYKEKHGDCLVPRNYTEEGHKTSLGRWVSNQRLSKANMSDEQRAMLDDIGFAWKSGIPNPNDHWKQTFEQLVAYKEGNGDCLVPTNFRKMINQHPLVDGLCNNVKPGKA